MTRRRSAPPPVDEHELVQLFRAEALSAPNSDDVLKGIHGAVRRRRRTRRAAGSAAVILTTAGIVTGVHTLLVPETSTGRTTATVVPTQAELPPKSSTTAAPGSPGAPAPVCDAVRIDPPRSQSQTLIEEFGAAGYTMEDAEELAALWRTEAPAQVKVLAAQQLRDGVALPLAPGQTATETGGSSATPLIDVAQEAFFSAGYDVADAAALAALWSEADLILVKAAVGQQLLDGATPPTCD